jgi:hypothetical protein
MKVEKYQCPECGSEEFISEPNRYDVFEFQENDFVVTNSHFINEYTFFCRECNQEINVELSIQNKRVTLKN